MPSLSARPPSHVPLPLLSFDDEVEKSEKAERSRIFLEKHSMWDHAANSDRLSQKSRLILGLFSV